MKVSKLVGITCAALASGAALIMAAGNPFSETVAWMAVGLAAAMFAILISRVRPRPTRSW